MKRNGLRIFLEYYASFWSGCIINLQRIPGGVYPVILENNQDQIVKMIMVNK
jgi:hypothetical protein